MNVSLDIKDFHHQIPVVFNKFITKTILYIYRKHNCLGLNKPRVGALVLVEVYDRF